MRRSWSSPPTESAVSLSRRRSTTSSPGTSSPRRSGSSGRFFAATSSRRPTWDAARKKEGSLSLGVTRAGHRARMIDRTNWEQVHGALVDLTRKRAGLDLEELGLLLAAE